ncbi:MAG TPA: putative Ig domain-containing protein, partial [Candidatus Eisenbacteria bacterium]
DADLPAQTLTFSLQGAPAGASIGASSGVFDWTPSEAEGPGSYAFTVRVSDGSASTEAPITLDVTEANVAPVLSGVPASATIPEQAAYTFTASASDADLPAQALAFSLDAGAPEGATINPSTGAFSWTPSEAQGPGDYTITVRVTDGGSPPLSDVHALSIHVDEVNMSPVLSGVPALATIAELVAFSFTASASDADIPAQALTFSLSGAPAGASIDPSTGAFGWTPAEAQGPGTYPFSVRVSDGPSTTSTGLTVTVDETNTAPVLAAIGNQSVNEGSLLSFTASATDADDPPQTLTYSLDTGAPAGAAIDPNTGVFSWTPAEAQGPGSYPVTVRVTDNGSPPLDDSETITIQVDEVNAAPVLSGVPTSATIPELAAYTFTASASDTDVPAQTLTFSLLGAPSGASIGGSTGVFTWTPSETQGPGVYAFTVQVTDGAANTGAGITLTVTEGNTAPVLAAIGNHSVNEGSLLSFTASATDADDPPQALTYSLDGGAPSGAAIDPNTGAFSWTPTEAQGPGSYPVTVRVTDNGSPPLDDSETITIQVDEVNAAPVLSGVPASATIPELVAYTFTASASDTDLPAQTLTFSLVGAPPGASIGGSTGVFTWTPSEAQGPGVYSFSVSVTDGGANTDAAITLTVDEVTIAAISDLSAAQVTSGNDSDGTTKIGVTWTATPEGTTVEVYRAGFGSYPEYDDAAGQVPATPSYPPGPPWALTSLAAPGGQDEPPTRDFYYYVAFVHGAGQNVSAASNQTQGTLDYHLGDVSDGATAGQGNNLVNTADVSLLGAYYGLSGPAVAPVAYLDVGPTTDFSTDARPITDDKLDFEDLIVFAIGYEVVSKPALAASAGSPAQPAAAADQLDLDAPGRVTPGQSVTARLALLGTGKVQGLSIRLEWDPAVVRPAAVAPSERFQQAGGVVLSARPGTLDAAILGVGAQMLAGRWEVGSMKFEVIGAGDPGIRIAEIRARDAANRKVEVAAGKVAPPRVLPTVTSLSLPAPNPFRQSTAFVVNLAQAARVDLAVYSLDGRRVRTLIDETREAGEYRQSWDGRDQHGATAAPGIYFVRLAAGPRVFTRTIVNLR